jgi:dipeptidyl aminopeptidase/acylaminoacyl peptidase
MECPQCHQEHPADTQFCPLTGEKFCTHCGQAADPASKNCTHCGRSLLQSTTIPSPPAAGFPKITWLILAVGLIGLFCVAVAVIILAVFWKNTNLTEVASTGSLTPVATSLSAPGTEALGRIAFESIRDGNLEIYVMNADGSNQTRLTDNPASDSDPTWSADGQKIAFASNRDGNWQIYIMNADGSNQTRLTNNQADDAYPAWSPDGQRIAFTSNRDGNLEIYVMNPDGSQQSRLTNNSGADSFPDWSGDGQEIVFQFLSDDDYTFGYEIYVMNAFGSARTGLEPGGYGGFYPSWSPDGQKIVFLSNRDQVWGIDVMNTDGSEPVRLTNKDFGGGYHGDFTENSFPSWSGDGQKIAFASARDGNAEIYVMNADGSQPARLTNNDAYDSMPDWSPSPSTSLTPSAPTGQMPIADSLVDPNLACALHGVAQPSEYSISFDEPSLYALSCLDQDGWHVYEPDMSAVPPQTPSWLEHLPLRPWSASLTPLYFPDTIAQCPGGRNYLVLGGHIYMLDGDRLIDIQADGFPKIDFMTCGVGNEIWAGYFQGVSHFDGSAWTHYPAVEYFGKGEFVELIRAITVTPHGDVWVATADSLARFDGTNWQVFEAGKGFAENPSGKDIAIDANGNVWVVNNFGLLKYDGREWSTYYDGAPHEIWYSNDMKIDSKNQVWVAMDSIYTFDPQTKSWTLQFAKEELSGGFMDMQFDRQGRLWIITTFGLDVYDGSKLIAYQTHTADLFANSADAILIFGNGPTLPALAPKAPGSIHGKLVNPDPKVFAKKQVELCLGSIGTDPVMNSYYYGETPCASAAFHVLTTVDADGNFEFTDVPLGTYYIAIEISGTTWVSMGDFKVNPGEKTELGEIAYPPEAR